MYTCTLNTPIGNLSVGADETTVFYIGFNDDPVNENPNSVSLTAKTQLEQYFTGNRNYFDFPVKQAGTEFQQKVWRELLKVPAGYPISYTSLSKRMNNRLAIRAIAAANAKNNLMIVVPCHRIIGANGDLVGYAGGLWRKKWLLEHEARMMKIGQATFF